MNPKQSRRNSIYFYYGYYSLLGTQLVGSVGVLGYLGQWLDKRWALTPVLTLTGLFLGAGVGFYNLFRMLKLQQDKDDAIEKEESKNDDTR